MVLYYCAQRLSFRQGKAKSIHLTGNVYFYVKINFILVSFFGPFSLVQLKFTRLCCCFYVRHVTSSRLVDWSTKKLHFGPRLFSCSCKSRLQTIGSAIQSRRLLVDDSRSTRLKTAQTLKIFLLHRTQKNYIVNIQKRLSMSTVDRHFLKKKICF